MKTRILSSEYINRHPYFTARVDKYQTPSGKIVDPYFVVEIPSSVVIMALTTSNEVLLVRQYRHPVNEMLVELPGGFIDPDEEPKQAAIRELQEETGYSFNGLHYLGYTSANPGVFSTYCHMFIAHGGVKTSDQSLDQNEEIEIILKPVDQVKLMLDQNEFRQSLHSLCLFYGFRNLESGAL